MGVPSSLALPPAGTACLEFGDHLHVGFDCRFRLGLIVLDNQLNLVFLAADFNAPGCINIFQPHLRSKFGALPHFGDIAGHRSVYTDFDGFGSFGTAGKEHQRHNKT
jgi:hypothetical protein